MYSWYVGLYRGTMENSSSRFCEFLLSLMHYILNQVGTYWSDMLRVRVLFHISLDSNISFVPDWISAKFEMISKNCTVKSRPIVLHPWSMDVDIFITHLIGTLRNWSTRNLWCTCLSPFCFSPIHFCTLKFLLSFDALHSESGLVSIRCPIRAYLCGYFSTFL